MFLSLLIFSLFAKIISTINLPSAPYNIKVFCRQGRRFAHTTHTPIQCPSSSTSCGYIEFPSPDRKVGLDNTGIYECVDNGMLSATVDADNKNASLFAALCGPVPQCSSLHIDSLNPTFSKYIITTYEIELETLTSRTLRFCCSLFHSTLQKLVNSGMDKLPSPLAPPVHCLSEICTAGAVGCLLHTTIGSEEEYDEEYDDRKRVKKQIDDYDGVSAMQLSFDYEEDNESFEFVSKVPETIHSDTISSRRVPQHPSKIISNASVTVETLHYQNYDSTGVRDEMHCVYRHFNDEFYRYCLMVHQRKDGDRCYYYKGHTVCCCFVPPDQETCDPTEMDLVRPPVTTRIAPVKVTALPPSARITYSVTTRQFTVPTATTIPTETNEPIIFLKQTPLLVKTIPKIERATTTTTTMATKIAPAAKTVTTTVAMTTRVTTIDTSSSSTTTTTSTTATTKKPLTTRKLTASRPPFIIRKPLNRRCRVTYPRSKIQRTKGRPVLLCDTSLHLTNHVITILTCFIILFL